MPGIPTLLTVHAAPTPITLATQQALAQVRPPVGQFVVEEFSGPSSTQPTGVKFTWSGGARSAPRGMWKQPVKLNTVRKVYPGMAEPVEQVLSWEFDEFTLAGVWDDRHMGTGGAVKVWRDFEALVQRGNLCRFGFDDVNVYGLIKNFAPAYKRRDWIEWEFTVSPHKRTLAPLKPVWAKMPSPFATQPSSIWNLALGDLYGLLPSWFSGTWLTDLANLMAEISRWVVVIEASSLQGLLMAMTPGMNQISSLISSYRAMRGACRLALAHLNSSRSDLVLVNPTGATILAYETQQRAIAYQTRLLVMSALRAEQALLGVSVPRGQRVYRPWAGQSLYDVAWRTLGDSGRWMDIALLNRLVSLELTGEELLLIPAA
jgi:hypothetical protein